MVHPSPLSLADECPSRSHDDGGQEITGLGGLPLVAGEPDVALGDVADGPRGGAGWIARLTGLESGLCHLLESCHLLPKPTGRSLTQV
jgi:hypothetical protein